MTDRTDLTDLNHLHRVEYLAMNLVQKLREMETPWMHFAAEASSRYGLDYQGPNFREELADLTQALKEKR